MQEARKRSENLPEWFLVFPALELLKTWVLKLIFREEGTPCLKGLEASPRGRGSEIPFAT